MSVGLHVIPPWLVIWVRRPIRVDLCLLDRFEANADNSGVLLTCGELTVALEVADGPDVPARIVGDAAALVGAPGGEHLERPGDGRLQAALVRMVLTAVDRAGPAVV